MWSTTPPEVSEHDVFIRYPDGTVDFGFVTTAYNSDGSVCGMMGPMRARVVAWRKILFPFDDGRGWHRIYGEGGEEPKKDGFYVVTVHVNGSEDPYRIRKAYFEDGLWNVRDCDSRDVLAWMRIPAASGRSH